jgi:hypothetical protein
MHPARSARLLLPTILGALFLGAPALAQDAAPPRHSASSSSIELSLSAGALDLGFRAALDNDDRMHLGLLLDDDEDWAVGGRWEHALLDHVGDTPLRLSIGLEAQVVSFDRPDARAYALAAAASAEVPLPTDSPLRLALDVAFAPDLTTFDDGERLRDFGLRCEVDVSPRAALFLGYRELDVDLERGGDEELDGHFGLGLRFAL